ncbi:MAG TPA: methyl-accepting chemotaxis protein [Bacteroidales bacterium]|nr:methyl-accepting chemotaxis protein [Bacteroidales bacterium]
MIKNLRTSVKLGGGFGLLIFFTACVCLMGWLGINKVYKQVNVLEDLGTVRAEFNLARLYARSFIHTKQMHFGNLADSTLGVALAKLDKMKGYVNSEESTEQLVTIVEGIGEYRVNFSKCIENVGLLLNIIAEADELSKTLEEQMAVGNQIQSKVINSYFKEARIYANKYIIMPKDEHIIKAHENIRKAIEVASAQNGPVLEALNRYQITLNNLQNNIQEQATIDLKQVPLGSITTKGFNKLVELSDRASLQAKRGALSFMVIFTLFALISGAVISILITRYTTSMLKKGVDLATSIAAGNINHHVTAADLEAKDEIGVLLCSLVDMTQKIKGIISEILTGAKNFSRASSQISSTTQQLSQGANEQAASSEEVSSSIEQMFSSIQQNSDNSILAEKIASKTLENMKEVSKASEKSFESVRGITPKISIINDIAFQTNILALNAAVEAARAGDHGKGFAVVAAEVRKLAEKSKHAANEIKELSNISFNVTAETEKLMASIIPEIERNARLAQEISAASQEQSNGSTQINMAIQQLSEVTQQNAAASEQLATSAEQLESQAEQLKSTISYFKIG